MAFSACLFCIFTYSNAVNGKYSIFLFWVFLQKCPVANKSFTAPILSLSSSFFLKPPILRRVIHFFFLVNFYNKGNKMHTFAKPKQNNY